MRAVTWQHQLLSLVAKMTHKVYYTDYLWCNLQLTRSHQIKQPSKTDHQAVIACCFDSKVL